MGKEGNEWKSQDYDGENMVNSETQKPAISEPEIKIQKRGTPPPNVDYLGWMEKQR